MAAQSRVAPLNIKAYLDRLYATYDLSYIRTSAAQFPHRYHRPEDIEMVGFIASCFAYGRVEGFTPPIGAHRLRHHASAARPATGLWKRTPLARDESSPPLASARRGVQAPTPLPSLDDPAGSHRLRSVG